MKKKFFVTAKCKQVKAYNGSILTREDTEVFFGMSEGYPSLTEVGWTSSKPHYFTSEEEARKAVDAWDGMPWFYKLKRETVVVHDVSDDPEHMTREELVAEVKRLRDKIEDDRLDSLEELPNEV